MVRCFLARSPRLTTLVPVLVGCVIAWETWGYFSRSSVRIEDPRYLVARRALPEGQPITAIDFRLLPLPRETQVPVGAMTDQELHLLKGASTKRALASGQWLTYDLVRFPEHTQALGKTVPAGMRAYVLHDLDPVDVHLGDVIDLLLSPRDSRELPMTLLEGVRVLRVESSGELALAVSSPEIQILEKAMRKGKLAIALRNPSDAALRRASPEGSRLLLPGKTKRRIEILSEGE